MPDQVLISLGWVLIVLFGIAVLIVLLAFITYILSTAVENACENYLKLRKDDNKNG